MIKDTENEFYRSILESLPDGVFTVDTQNNITFWNQVAENVTGFASSEIVGKVCGGPEGFQICADTGACRCRAVCAQPSTKNGQVVERSVFIAHKDGYRIPVTMRTHRLLNASGDLIGVVNIFPDARTRQRVEQKLNELAALRLIHPVSGVGNQHYVRAQLELKLADAREKGTGFGVLLAEVGQIGSIERRFGGEAKEKALRTVAHSLMMCLRATDILGTWGNSSFLILSTTNLQDELKAIAERLRFVTSHTTFGWWGDTIALSLYVTAVVARPNDVPSAVLGALEQLHATRCARQVVAAEEAVK